LQSLLGEPSHRETAPDDWNEIERYVGSALPGDFKTFLDAYGSGVISGELVVFHPRGSSPLLERMLKTHALFTERRNRNLDLASMFRDGPSVLPAGRFGCWDGLRTV